MAHQFHTDKPRYFKMQADNCRNYMLPFIGSHFNAAPESSVLEIGCAEGGVLLPFLEAGCMATGVELMPHRLELAKQFLSDYVETGQVSLLASNIYDVTPEQLGHFDLIILKDVIEHIPEQEKLLGYLKTFLKPNGGIFLGFPPWYMPFGGHQQVCSSKLLKWLPYFHLLPTKAYEIFLKAFGETPKTIAELIEIKETGISTGRFLKISKANHYKIDKVTYYLLNPIYSFKFGLKPIAWPKAIGNLPIIRSLLVTAIYVRISPR